MKSKQTPRQALNLPAGYFGMVLGTIGMGFAWRYASTLWPVSRSIGDDLVMLAIAMWALLSMAFISRAIRFPASVLREMRHPVSSSFVSLFPATTLLVAIGLVPWWRPLALGLFVPGVALQLAYAAWQSGGLWRGTHPHEATTPGLYLPTVANNFISAMACGALGFTDAGLVFLGAGVFSWLSLEPAILQRLRCRRRCAPRWGSNWRLRWWPAAPGSASTVGKRIPSRSCCLVTACCSYCSCCA